MNKVRLNDWAIQAVNGYVNVSLVTSAGVFDIDGLYIESAEEFALGILKACYDAGEQKEKQRDDIFPDSRMVIGEENLPEM